MTQKSDTSLAESTEKILYDHTTTVVYSDTVLMICEEYDNQNQVTCSLQILWNESGDSVTLPAEMLRSRVLDIVRGISQKRYSETQLKILIGELTAAQESYYRYVRNLLLCLAAPESVKTGLTSMEPKSKDTIQ